MDDDVIFTSIWPLQGQIGTTVVLSADENPYKENIRPGSLTIVDVRFITIGLPYVVVVTHSALILDAVGYSRFSVVVPPGLFAGVRYVIVFTLVKTTGAGVPLLFRTSPHNFFFTVV